MANNTGKKFGGRGAGTPNKLTKDLRELITQFLSDNWSKMENDFEALEPKDRILFYEKLLKYAVPQLQNTTLETQFENLTDEQLDYIINQLKSNFNE